MSDAKTILDDIARELEGAGYAHMCNGPGIKSILAEHEALQAKYNAAVAAVGGFITPAGGDLASAVNLISLRCSMAEKRTLPDEMTPEIKALPEGNRDRLDFQRGVLRCAEAVTRASK